MNPSERMAIRPPVLMVCYNDAQGNPQTYTVGYGCTEIRETEEYAEFAAIPWVEIWDGERLLARFNQHKLEHILY